MILQVTLCIRYYNGIRAGPDLVGVMMAVVACCCSILLQLALMLADLNLALVVFSFHELVQILHWHTWLSAPVATCAGGTIHTYIPCMSLLYSKL